MLMGELLTVAQYELPVKILVFNNHSLGMVQLEMEVAGYPRFGCDLKNPNFALLAQAIGMGGSESKIRRRSAPNWNERWHPKDRS